jgi:hypothetical protein
VTPIRLGALAILILGITLTAGSGCGACTLSVEPGIVVEIRDAVDGAPIAATASGSVTEGSFQDSLHLYDAPLRRAGAYEREGTYTVRVLHPGYVPWERSRVRVRDTGCSVATVTLQADLQRAP